MRAVVLAGLALALLACSKKEPPAPIAVSASSAPSPAPSPVASTLTPVPLPSASSAAIPEVPVEEDFEDEANQKVTAQSLDSQLDALEKEIKAN